MSAQPEDDAFDPVVVPTRDAQDAALWRVVEAYLQLAISHADAMRVGPRALGEALCSAIDTISVGAPRFELFSDMRADAEWWADCATPLELEIYSAAALRRIESTMFAPRARKRIFMHLWKSFSHAEQQKFLNSMKEQG